MNADGTENRVQSAAIPPTTGSGMRTFETRQGFLFGFARLEAILSGRKLVLTEGLFCSLFPVPCSLLPVPCSLVFTSTSAPGTTRSAPQSAPPQTTPAL